MPLNKNEMKVTIIIPLYNQKQFIGQAIESALVQTYKNIEIIVVNDGSTDSPDQELYKYKNSIKLINQDNIGLAGARNTGIENSSGEYVQFLDADDFLHPDKLKIQLNFMREVGARISYCEIAQYQNYDGSSFIRYIGPLHNPFINLYNLWLPYPLPIHSLLLKREVFRENGGFDIELKAAEDRYFLSKLALKKENFYYYPFIGGGRRLHGRNMNLNRIMIYENMIKYYKRINKLVTACPIMVMENNKFTAHQMMEANLTYMYLGDIANGTSRPILNKIKYLLHNNKIKYNYAPIPNAPGITNSLLLNALLRRWYKILMNRFGVNKANINS